MSEIKFSPERVEELYAGIQGLKPVIESMPDGERIQMALRSALVANRAALAMTYGEEAVIPRCELPKGFNQKAEPGEVFNEICLLFCNCISKGGRSYLPGQDKAILDAIREAIARHELEKRTREKEVSK